MTFITLLVVCTFFLICCIPLILFAGSASLFLMFLLTALFSYLDHFMHVSYSELTILFLVACAAFVVDLLSGILGAMYSGASKRSILFGIVGLVLGTLIIPLPVLGSFIGMALGIFIGEVSIGKKSRAALKSVTAGVIGSLTGTLLNTFLALTFVGLFIFFSW